MSERNKQLVRRVIEQAVNEGNLVYREAIAEKPGRDGFRHLVITYHTPLAKMTARLKTRDLLRSSLSSYAPDKGLPLPIALLTAP